MEPLVSVVIPSYNRRHVVAQAIESVQAGSYENWELIVVDDRSTDDTRSLVESLATKDPRIRYVSNRHGRGSGGARNQGIELAKGELVAFLDSDDLWLPRKLETQVEFLDDHADTAMVAGDYWIADDDSDRSVRGSSVVLESVDYWERDELTRSLIPCERIRSSIAVVAEREAILNQAITGHLWIQTSSVVVRRSVFEEVGKFEERLLRTEDMKLWLRINDRFGIGYLDTPLAVYDITGRENATGPRYQRQATDRRHSRYEEFRYHLLFRKFIGQTFSLTADQRRLLRKQLRRRHREMGFLCRLSDRPRSFGHYMASLYYSPRDVFDLIRSPMRFFKSP